jgi:hypothetical protein
MSALATVLARGASVIVKDRRQAAVRNRKEDSLV